MNGADQKQQANWKRRIGNFGVWGLLLTTACVCSAQTPVGSLPKPPQTSPTAPTAGKTTIPPTTGDASAQNVLTLPANAVLPILLNYSLWNNSLMEADVQINGVVEHCIVDTGLNACAVTPEASTRLKVAMLSTQGTITTLNETRTAPEAELKNLQFNQIKFDSLRAIVTNAAELYTTTLEGDSPALWLGTPFLAAFQVTFDYTGHFIALDRPDAAPPKVKGAIILTMPLEIRGGRLYTRVNIPKGGTFSALINTGTIGTLIPAAVAAKLKIKPTKTFDVKWTGGKKGKASLITLPEMQIGRLSQQQVPVLYFEPEGDAEIDRALGVLGADFLSHYKVIINIAHKKLMLITPPPDKPDDKADTPPPVKPPTRKPKK